MQDAAESGGDTKVAEARIEAQNAVQWLARIARSFAPVEGDRDILLFWDPSTKRISTPEVAPHTALDLYLPSLTLQFSENGHPSPYPIEIEEKSSTEIEAWLLVEMLHRGFERERFSKRLPYRWDRMMSGDEAKYSPEQRAEELQTLTSMYESASDILMRTQTVVLADAAKLDQLHCWPDGFEIGFALPPSADGGDTILEVGFTPGFDDRIKPGFFVRRGPSSGATEQGLAVELDIEGGDSQAKERAAEKLVEAIKNARAAFLH